MRKVTIGAVLILFYATCGVGAFHLIEWLAEPANIGCVDITAGGTTYQADDAPQRMKSPNEALWAFKEAGSGDLILIHGDFTVRLPKPVEGGK